jgi:hypothetical protein
MLLLALALIQHTKTLCMINEEAAMERQRLAVTKRVGIWGSVYIIGGTEVDGETLPAEQADDLIARFEHEQALFGRALIRAVEVGGSVAAPMHSRNPAGVHADGFAVQ